MLSEPKFLQGRLRSPFEKINFVTNLLEHWSLGKVVGGALWPANDPFKHCEAARLVRINQTNPPVR